MKKLFRIHFTAIAVIDLLLTKDPRHLWSGSCYLVLFSSLLKDSCYFAWLSD